MDSHFPSFSLLNDEQMRHWLGVEHQPVVRFRSFGFSSSVCRLCLYISHTICSMYEALIFIVINVGRYEAGSHGSYGILEGEKKKGMPMWW